MRGAVVRGCRPGPPHVVRGGLEVAAGRAERVPEAGLLLPHPLCEGGGCLGGGGEEDLDGGFPHPQRLGGPVEVAGVEGLGESVPEVEDVEERVH